MYDHKGTRQTCDGSWKQRIFPVKMTLSISVFGFEYFFEWLDDSKLECDLCSDSQEGHEQALVEGGDAFFLNGFFEGMDVALIVLIGTRDNFDFDVFEGEHGEYLSPAGSSAAE